MSDPNNVHVKNRKARFEYHLLDCYVAGIQLQGTEIKSVRQGKVSLQESYCFMRKRELFVKNLHISEYKQGNIYNHEPKRLRKLLLKKKELKKIEDGVKTKGMTVIPSRLFISKSGFAKLEVCLAKGKKIYDKRETIKKRQDKKDVKRQLKNY